MEISLAKKRVISYSVSYKVLFSGTDNNIEGSRNCLPSACAQPPKGKLVLWASFTESFIFQGSEEFSVFLKNLSWKRLQEKMVRRVRVKNLPTFFLWNINVEVTAQINQLAIKTSMDKGCNYCSPWFLRPVLGFVLCCKNRNLGFLCFALSALPSCSQGRIWFPNPFIGSYRQEFCRHSQTR